MENLVPDSPPVGLTEHEQLENLKAASIAERWKRKHPDLLESPDNANKIGNWLIDNKNGQFTLETLDVAFEAIKDTLDFEKIEAPEPKEQLEPQPFPWPSPLTKKIIGQMSREDYRKFYNNPEFRKQLLEIGIK